MRNEKTKLNIKRDFKLLVVVLSFAFCFFSLMLAKPTMAASASLYLSPSAGTYAVGNTFLVEIKLNSGGAAINASDGTLIFNPNNLEVRSISKERSIFSLWVEEPTFSNSLGTINFAGGKPSPGFTGTAGIIFTVTFKARTSGNTNLTFAVGSILADDGKGTNILTNMSGGTYTLSAREISPVSPDEEEEYIPPSTQGQAPAAPVVSSPTHPDENKWYSNNSPEFNWKLPSDVTGVSLLLHENVVGDPGSISDGLIDSKKFEDIEDGIWYFHIKFRNEYGWGEILHRKVLIDTKSPEPFHVTVDNKGDSTNPTPVFVFETRDSLSGIEYYEVKTNEEKATTTPQNIKDKPYQPLPLAPGKYALEVKAYDKADNNTSASTEFEILPIKGVEITKIPISIRIGETLEIEGRAEPEITVRIYIQKLEKEPILEKVKADLTGKFVLSYDKALAKDDYVVWAQAEDERGALSYPTKKYNLEVGLPPFLKFGKIVLDYLTTMITLIILIIGLFTMLLWIIRKMIEKRRILKKEITEAEKSVSAAFRSLKEEIEKQIAEIDRNPKMSAKEKKISDNLKKALDISKESIDKEIRDVKGQIRKLDMFRGVKRVIRKLKLWIKKE